MKTTPILCPICDIKKDFLFYTTLPCLCSCCNKCLTTWTISQIQELHFQTNKQIKCIQSTCLERFYVEEFFSQLNPSQRNKINRALLTDYLKTTNDVRSCPSSGCNYRGIIDLNSTCKEKLECEKCGHKWFEIENLSTSKRILSFLSPNSSQRNELFSSLWKEAFSRCCPNCGIHIEKDGGCKHIACTKCQYEFCWYCNSNYSRHQMQTCEVILLTKFFIYTW